MPVDGIVWIAQDCVVLAPTPVIVYHVNQIFYIMEDVY